MVTHDRKFGKGTKKNPGSLVVLQDESTRYKNLYLKDFAEPTNPELSVVQFKQVLIEAVRSLFGITGACNQIDVLKYTDTDRTAIIRIHHRFLAQFWASLTLYSEHEGIDCAFRVLQVSSHLMALAANSRLTPVRVVTDE